MASLWPRGRESLHGSAVTCVLWGLLLLLFGAALITWPDRTGAVLVTLLGAFIAVAGIVLAFGALRLRRQGTRLWVLALVPAVAVVMFGSVVLLLPDLVSTVVLLIVAVLVVITGVADIIGSFAILAIAPWWWLRFLRGLVLAGSGLWVLTDNPSGLAAIGVLAAIWAFVLGALSLACGILAARVRV